jgi:hypothetical protein
MLLLHRAAGDFLPALVRAMLCNSRASFGFSDTWKSFRHPRPAVCKKHRHCSAAAHSVNLNEY